MQRKRLFVAPILLAYDEAENSVRKTSRDLDKQILEIGQRFIEELEASPGQDAETIIRLKKLIGKDDSR